MLDGYQPSAAERERLVLCKIAGAVLLRELYQAVGVECELAALILRKRRVVGGRARDVCKRLLYRGGCVLLHDLLDKRDIVGKRLFARLGRLLDYSSKQRGLGIHDRVGEVLSQGLAGHQKLGAYVREAHQALFLGLVGIEPVYSACEKHVFIEKFLEYHQWWYLFFTDLHFRVLLVAL